MLLLRWWRTPRLAPVLLWGCLVPLRAAGGRALLVLLWQELVTRVLVWLYAGVALRLLYLWRVALWRLSLWWVGLLLGRRVALVWWVALRRLLWLPWVALARVALLLVRGARVGELLHLRLALCEQLVESGHGGGSASW